MPQSVLCQPYMHILSGSNASLVKREKKIGEKAYTKLKSVIK